VFVSVPIGIQALRGRKKKFEATYESSSTSMYNIWTEKIKFASFKYYNTEWFDGSFYNNTNTEKSYTPVEDVRSYKVSQKYARAHHKK
jgi:hypothetical protein